MLEPSINLEPGILEYEEKCVFGTDRAEVIILGKKFNSLKDFDKIKSDINSRIWFTYRRGFSPIGGVGPTSDQGWGCMLRCGQMMLAQALLLGSCGRDFNWNRDRKNGHYLDILRMFVDQRDRIFSIHQIAQMGLSEGKEVGQWFGPNTVAQVLKKLAVYERSRVAVHVAMDNALVLEDTKRLATTDPDSWSPLLIVIPLRLGLTSLNICYSAALQRLFSIPQCVGVIGGRPNHALYFIGSFNGNLLYLDPHYCQEFVDLDLTDADDTSFHSSFIHHINIDDIDPSLALGFFCSTEHDLDLLSIQLNQEILQHSPPLFDLLENRPAGWPHYMPYTGESTPPNQIKEFTVLERSNTDTDDDFEILC